MPEGRDMLRPHWKHAALSFLRKIWAPRQGRSALVTIRWGAAPIYLPLLLLGAPIYFLGAAAAP